MREHDCESNKQGVEIMGAYDGVLYWRCQVCGLSWHRFTAESNERLRWRAQQYIDQSNMARDEALNGAKPAPDAAGA